MKSVLSLLIISIFAIIVYGWSLNFFDKHRDKPKKLYISSKISDKHSKHNRYSRRNDNSSKHNRYSRYGDNSSRYGDNDSRYGDDDSRYGERQIEYDSDGKIITCEDNPCGEFGNCNDDKDYGYYCECNQGYSGDKCEFNDDDSLGVRVEILERDNQLLPPIIFDLDVIDKPKSNQWNSYL